jgi:hypothetical protein
LILWLHDDDDSSTDVLERRIREKLDQNGGWIRIWKEAVVVNFNVLTPAFTWTQDELEMMGEEAAIECLNMMFQHSS